MNFNAHSNLIGQHAFLGASQYHWVNYDEDKIDEAYIRWKAKQRGTELHEFAANAIRLGVSLPRNNKTLNRYVNDAIGYQMAPEQVLYYSLNCFGTADAISFKKNFLRIHDLKTGDIAASILQLYVYAALFCLEYNYTPDKIGMELRIYQSDDVRIDEPSPKDIFRIMDKIVVFDKRIEKLKTGG